jgi:hypothetical protein
MKRDIVTKAQVQQNAALTRKIEKAKIAAHLDEDLDTHNPVMASLRSTMLSSTVPTDDSSLSDLLDGDIDAKTAAIVSAKRVEILENKATAQSTADNYGDKLVKYIPTEVIAFYSVLMAALPSVSDANQDIFAWGIIGVGILCTLAYLKRVSQVTSNVQIIVSCFAFFAWALGLSEAIHFDGKMLIIPVVTFLIPLIDPPTPSARVGK